MPLQIRNAPTKLMKTLGYGKEYSYNPDFAHPVINEYLPFTLAEHSSYAPDPARHILRSMDAEQKDKTWDDDRLSEWEWRVQGGMEWVGRKDRKKGSHDSKGSQGVQGSADTEEAIQGKAGTGTSNRIQ